MKTRILGVVIFLSLFSVGAAVAEDVAVPPAHKGLTFRGFLDGYYAYDQEYPNLHQRPYTTQALYSNGARPNLGFLDAKLDVESWRGRLAVQYGDSVRANYAAEKEEFWRYFQEATVGYKLSDNLWIDGGIYLSHIGFESFNSRDNWNYTRSLVAEYSPYYESGVKLNYAMSDTLTAQVHVLHGWQNITLDQDPAFGGQLSYAVSPTTQLTYANFLGDQNGFRNFHDFIAKTDVTKSWSMALQFDVGNQNLPSNGGNVWWQGVSLMSRYKVTPSLSLGTRVEWYSDPHQVVFGTASDSSYNTTGFSVNVDYEVARGVVWRNEYRAFFGNHRVFPQSTKPEFAHNDFVAVTSLAYSFDLGGLS